MLAEQKPAEQHAKRRHHEVIGARRGRARHVEQVEPEQIGEDRDEQRQIGKATQRAASSARCRRRFRTRRRTAASRDRPRGFARRCRSRVRPSGASFLNRMVPPTSETSAASVNAMPTGCSTPPASRLSTTKATPPMPSSRPAALRQVIALVEEHRRQHGGQHRVGADDERREAGRDAARCRHSSRPR